MKVIPSEQKKLPVAAALLNAFAKSFLIKPSLKFIRSRTQYPKFWTMPYDTICKEILVEGLYEKSTMYGMCQLARKGNGIALDIGANMGNHSIYFSSHFSKVIAFEPSERNNWIMKANLELNDITNVMLIEKGLSDSRGFIELGNDANKFDTNNGFDPKASLSPVKVNRKMVEIAIADDEIEALALTEEIAMIKIDVEGLEPKVIKGLRKTIDKHRPVLFWEAFTPQTVQESRVVLEECGYRHFYHLAGIRDQSLKGKINKMRGNTDCTLTPLESCTSFHGMNVASFKELI